MMQAGPSTFSARSCQYSSAISVSIGGMNPIAAPSLTTLTSKPESWRISSGERVVASRIGSMREEYHVPSDDGTARRLGRPRTPDKGRAGSMSRSTPGGEVKALVFDTFGTVVDWRSSVIKAGEKLSREIGQSIDWAAFAEEWRRVGFHEQI